MKVIKKICVYLLVGLLCCSSVAISYEKANTCQAISIGVGAAFVVTLGLLLLGGYYVSQPENQEEIKESLSNYKNMTEEGMKSTYEMNKKIFNDFIDYATSNGGGSAAVYSADGRSYTVNEMAAEGFPEFEKWDEEMKKQGDSSGGGFGSIWDKLSFGLDLLDFVRDFFKDDEQQSDIIYKKPFTIYTGDSGYINRSTGYFCGFVETDGCNSAGFAPVGTLWDYPCVLQSDNDYISRFRVAVGINSPTWAKYYDGYGGNTYRIYCTVFDSNGDASVGVVGSSSTFGPFIRCNAFEVNYTFWGTDYTNITYISTNLPVFVNDKELSDYLLGLTDGSNCVNSPDFAVSSSTKNVIQYCNYFNGKNVSPADIVNVNYNISNNWDGTTENLTMILNDQGGESEKEVTPIYKPTSTPIPYDTDDTGGDNNIIYNFYTNITQTVENIYNFFQIDTEQITQEIKVESPTSKLSPLVSSINKLKSAFPSDTYEEDSGVLVADYPKITMKCPKILEPVVDTTDENGKKIIVIVDFKDYAVWFIRLRAFLEVVLWIGMFFFLLKEFRVVFSLS